MASDSGTRDRIPPIRRYKIGYRWNAVKPVDGEWVRYDDHVAAVKLMQSEVEKLEEQVAELNENLRDEKLDVKDLQKTLRGFKQ